MAIIQRLEVLSSPELITTLPLFNPNSIRKSNSNLNLFLTLKL